MKNLSILVTLAFCACSSTPNKDQPVAVKHGDDYYALDKSAQKALSDKDSKERVICKRRQVTGTHFKKKTCTTASQAKKDRENAKRLAERNKDYVNKALTNEHRGN